MDGPPSREQVYSRLRSEYPGKVSFPEHEFQIMGVTATYFDLADNGFNGWDAYRTGGLHGTVFERADDAIDGEHGFDPVDDVTGFLDKSIDVLRTGEVPEAEYDSAIPAYRSVSMMNELLESPALDNYVDRFEDVVELEKRILSIEDTVEGYRLHLESGGRTYLAMFEALSGVTGYPVEGRRDELEAAGKLFQSTDDIQDVEIDAYPVDREDIRSIQEDLIAELEDGRISRRGFAGFVEYFPKADDLVDLKRFL